jgi:hypothetical protein
MGIFFLAASCAILFPDRTAPKSSSYQVTPPDQPWHKLAVGNDSASIDAMKADMAYENPESGAIISLNSLCRKYTDESLQDLTNNLVRGIGKREVLSSAEREVSGTDALDTLFEGEVDNVKLHIRTVVLKKSDCTYDFIYVCIPRREGNSGQAFEKFLSSFRAD